MDDNDELCEISPKYCILFELINRGSFEFYGFHENILLSFEGFSEFFVEDEESTKKLIESCSFARKQKE